MQTSISSLLLEARRFHSRTYNEFCKDKRTDNVVRNPGSVQGLQLEIRATKSSGSDRSGMRGASFGGCDFFIEFNPRL